MDAVASHGSSSKAVQSPSSINTSHVNHHDDEIATVACSSFNLESPSVEALVQSQFAHSTRLPIEFEPTDYGEYGIHIEYGTNPPRLTGTPPIIPEAPSTRKRYVLATGFSFCISWNGSMQ